MHNKTIKEALAELKSSEKGLSSHEAKKRLEKHGYNQIEEKEKISAFRIFIGQFKSFIIWILIIAVIISAFLGEMVDAAVILAIVVLNAIFGFMQEYKAEKAIEALKNMASLKATVLRDGNEFEIDAKEVVPGDIIILSEGEKIPADARLIEIVMLETQEASLTGESLPVPKHLRVLDKDVGIADRVNMVFSGTIITKGKGKAVATATGMKTEIGKIAHMIQTVKQETTPLQKKLEKLSKFIAVLVLAICAVVFLVGILRGGNAIDMLISAVSLAVAAIPEGLPAIVTISLALGVQRMVKRNALMRKLPSVETLGSCTVICSDKTGTLTHNEMTVKKIYVNNKVVDVSGSGYSPEGKFSSDPKEFLPLLRAGALCNDASLDKNKSWNIIGDPTEGALLVSAAKAGFWKKELELRFKRVEEIIFSSERKRMTTIHKAGNDKIAYMKGAPDVVLELCTKMLVNGKEIALSKSDKENILRANEEFASSALRVLGFAYKKLYENEKDIEKGMTFVGLQGMIDPPRAEAKSAIAKCKKAGIKVVMITGDHKATAMAVARELDIQGRAITGQELDKINNFEDIVEDIAIYARVNPEHKLKIVDALKKRGHIVAMTGDGVNDAPALKKADIGIAMGITGTDVSKEASDMILMDDNFVSIVNAIEEGRTIFDNIRKFVDYLLSSNMGEVLTMLIGIILFTTAEGSTLLPLLALQILWINLITDGLPALALGVEPPEKGVMERLPVIPKEKIMNNERIIMMLIIGIIMAIGTLGIFKYCMPETNIIYAQTMAFTTLVMFQMFNVLNQRSERESLFKIGIFKNIWLWGAIIVSVGLQFLVLYTPLNSIFRVVPLTGIDWLIVVAVSASVFVAVEIIKLARKIF